MIYLDIGEWPLAGVGLGLAFLVAITAVSGLGWWVLRGDRINRTYQEGATEHRGAEEQPH